MTLTLQPPEKNKDSAAEKPVQEKPGGEVKQNPAKTEDKPVPGKDTTTKTDALPNRQDKPQVEQQQQPIIPLQPPPGAQIPVQPKEPKKDFRVGAILEPALWLIAILALGAILLAWLKKNRDRQAGGIALTANQQLSAFRDSLEEGDMTEEEFKKVKAHLAEKIRQPAKPVTTVPAQTPPADANAPPSVPNN